jgi:ubiquinol-cytochrome c reductase cytochrome b subunit
MSTMNERAAARKRARLEQGVANWADDRLGSSKWLRSALDKIFPDHWSFMVGEIAMYSFIILLVTGTYLAFFYNASGAPVVYHGPYKPLDGQTMTSAYASVIRLSFSVRAGLVMRQAHHWAALIFVAAIVFHMFRVFFTGAFRRPREINWVIGTTLLLIAMLEGFSGYSLPDDLLSGGGLRILYSIIQSVPIVGTWLASDIWGGNTFPGNGDFFPRLFVIHEFIFPLALAGLLTVHLGVLWHQKHTDFAGPGKTERNIVGSRLWPQYAVKSTGLLMFISGVIFGLGGLVQINPVWVYGPYQPGRASSGTQPDWYIGWLDGALRLWPHWEFRSFGHEIANPFFPGVLIPGIIFTIIYAWPWVDKRIYGDYGEHNLLDRPRDKPLRTAIGVAALAFFVDLTLASATDLIGSALGVSFEALIEILQYGTFVGPVVAGVVTYRACLALQHGRAHPVQRPVGGIIVRDAQGGYHTLGAPHDEEAGKELVEDALLERVGAGRLAGGGEVVGAPSGRDARHAGRSPTGAPGAAGGGNGDSGDGDSGDGQAP